MLKKPPKTYQIIASSTAEELRHNVEYSSVSIIRLLSLTELELRAGGMVKRKP
jgi:hypothetical protein